MIAFNWNFKTIWRQLSVMCPSYFCRVTSSPGWSHLKFFRVRVESWLGRVDLWLGRVESLWVIGSQARVNV